jgi:hypothetical protein
VKKKINLEITELFLAKAGRSDYTRCFMGTIRREADENGILILISRVPVNKYGFNEVVISSASFPGMNPEDVEKQLGDQLDEMVLMMLDHRLAQMEASVEKSGDLTINLN